MLINELSKRTGISSHTIRFYEKSGLIKGKKKEAVTSNNYYHYDEDCVEKLLLIRDAKSVGFTLSEIGDLIDAWYNDGISVNDKLAILDNKLAEIEQKIKEMKQMKKLIGEFRKSVQTDNC
jgi:MerR family Zn(II)-responsive transcriptional regulator of zntA